MRLRPGWLWLATVVVALIIAAKIAQVLIDGASADNTDLAAYVDGAERIKTGRALYVLPMDLDNIPPHYVYPPVTALIFTIFDSYQSAWWSWAAISILCWMLAVGIVLYRLRDALHQRLTERGWPLLVSALLVFPPVVAHLIWGQLQLLILLLLVGCWWCLRSGRPLSAGALLGAAIAVKVYPAVLLMPLLLQRRWQVVASSLVWAALLGLGSFWIVDPDLFAHYIREVMPAVNAHGESLPGNYALLDHLGHLSGIAARVILLSLLGLISLRDSSERPFVLGVTVMVLLLSFVWAHYFTLLLLPWLDILSRVQGRLLMLHIVTFVLLSTASAVFVVPLALVPAARLAPVIGVLLLFATQVLVYSNLLERPVIPRSRPLLSE